LKLAAIGSRSFCDYTLLCETLDQYLPVDFLISGGAVGADYLAHQWALSRKVLVLIYRPDWRANGKRAGIIRNAAMVEAADRIIAFWDGTSRGTGHTINMAKKSGKPILVVPFGHLLRQQTLKRKRHEETLAREAARRLAW